jgi:hypothetical protein
MSTAIKSSIERPCLRSLFILMLFALGSFAVPRSTQAVETAAPDTALAGGNTADGQGALFSLTAGLYNSAFGLDSLLSLTDGNFCTGVGAGTLLVNTASNNTATGAGALLSNTTGADNTANGTFALFSNTTGVENTGIGDGALESNTAGFDNTATGFQALLSNVTGFSNTATGVRALISNTSAGNTAIGQAALDSNTTGSDNVALGYFAGDSVITADHVICIGANVFGANVSNTTWIANVYGTTTVSGTTLPVLASDTGQLGTMSSSRRFKKEIKPMDSASEAVLALKPVTFHYKSDAGGTPQFGLIAEEVAEVNPDLVVRDADGQIYTVRYDAVNAMLLNEFLKEHKKVEQQVREIQEQRTTIGELKKGMDTVIGHLKEQDSNIQKVSDQIEMKKARPGVVRNDP